MEEDDDECYTIKCGLARLGANLLVVKGIDLVAASVQRLAARASLFANHCVIYNIRNGADVSCVFTQTWWHNVITRFVTLEKSAGEDVSCPFPEMTAAFAEFQSLGRVDFVLGDHYWSFIATLAKDMLTNAKTMVARQFHNLLSKAVSRAISLWELENGRKLKKGLPYAAHRYFHHQLFGSRTRSKKRASLPEDFPPGLRDVLSARAASWKTKFPQICSKCAKPEWIKPGHLSAILLWEHEILAEKYSYLRRVQLLKRCTKRQVYGLMRKGCLKGSLLLPVSSPEVKYIPFSPTTLADFFLICEHNFEKLLDDHPDKSPEEKAREQKEALEYIEPIVRGIRAAVAAKSRHARAARKERDAKQAKREGGADVDVGEPESKRRKLEGDELEAKAIFNRELYGKAFPNLERIKPRAKFKMFLRTDGVACSIVYERKAPGTGASGKQALCTAEKRDLESPSPPLVPREGQRLIGIDPGRRDMIVAVEHNSGEILKMSTRRHAHESGRANAKGLTLKTLRRIFIPSTGFNLLQTLSKSPPGKEIEKTHWERYLSFILPLLDVRAEAYRRRAKKNLRFFEKNGVLFLRRVRFENFMKKDKSLDTLCNRLCSLGRGTRDQTVLIAFGDGSHCSTGFGQEKTLFFPFSEGKCCSCAAAPVSETTRTDTRSARDVDSRGVHEPEMF
jgi:hypothetical protein